MTRNGAARRGSYLEWVFMGVGEGGGGRWGVKVGEHIALMGASSFPLFSARKNGINGDCESEDVMES